MERGKTAPPGEEKIVRMAAYLGQNHDEMLALAGKVSADIIHIILQKPKETADLLRRLSHAPPGRLKAYREALPAPAPLEFYPLATVSHENHTAVVGDGVSADRLYGFGPIIVQNSWRGGLPLIWRSGYCREASHVRL